MYSVTAEVLNCFSAPATDEYEKSYKVQLMGESPQKDGQVRKEMITLSVPEIIYNGLSPLVGHSVRIPISFFVSNGRLQSFFPKNSTLKDISKVESKK